MLLCNITYILLPLRFGPSRSLAVRSSHFSPPAIHITTPHNRSRLALKQKNVAFACEEPNRLVKNQKAEPRVYTMFTAITIH